MIKYIADSVEWFDKTNGNTYASTRVISTETGKTVEVYPFGYGYGETNARNFRATRHLDHDELYITERQGTRKQAEQWGKE